MAAPSNHPFDFVQPLGGEICVSGAHFRVSFDKRQCAEQTIADNDGEQNMFSAAGIAAERA